MDKAMTIHILLLMWFWLLVGSIALKLLSLAIVDYPIRRESVERWQHVIGLIINSVVIGFVWFAIWGN